MVTASDLRAAPASDNPFVSGLLAEEVFNADYVIKVVLQADPGDTGSYGGARWAANGAKQAFLNAVSAWMAVADVTIQVLPDNYRAGQNRSAFTWVETLMNLPDALGQHSLPGLDPDLGGDFNDKYFGFTAANNAVGGYSYVTFLHELGHGLGLSHPFDGPANFPGVTDSEDSGDNQLNQLGFTVMTYGESINGQVSPTDAYGWTKTPMAFDIAAIQAIYGANMSTAAGDTVYLLPYVNGSGVGWTCIWDAGGFDTISAEGAGIGSSIDLNAATLQNEPGGGGYFSRVPGIYGGFTIANGVVIEAAIGSNFDDTLLGNEADNVLEGRGGNDVIRGQGGADHLLGGAGFDSLFGGDGPDLLEGGADGDDLHGEDGNDILMGGAGPDSLEGGAGVDLLDGGSGDDSFYGSDGLDTFVGGTGDDIFYPAAQSELIFEDADGGEDRVEVSFGYYLYANIEDLWLQGDAAFGVGNESDNSIRGSNVSSILIGWGGNDNLSGGIGNDSIFGGDGDDVINGGGGIDYLVGGDGNDEIIGLLGADAIYGGDGDDILISDVLFWDPWAGAGWSPRPIDFVTDILVGGAGNDIIYGNSGLGDYDLLYGNEGNDTFYVDTPADLVFEQPGEGHDIVYAEIDGAGYYLYENIEDIVLVGDTPFGVGNGLDNVMTGSEASNWLLGGAGNDTLNGKGGNDVLFGESGADVFVFEPGTGGDVIGDFQPGEDRIDLSSYQLDWSALLNVMHEYGGTTAIDLGAGDFIVVNGIAEATFQPADFILV